MNFFHFNIKIFFHTVLIKFNIIIMKQRKNLFFINLHTILRFPVFHLKLLALHPQLMISKIQTD